VATIFILLVIAYFVITSDASLPEKLIVFAVGGASSLLPLAAGDYRVLAAVTQGAIGVYVVLRMTYLRAKDQPR
jgi:hypothetical protein